MKFTIVQSKDVSNQKEDFIIVIGIKHYRIGISGNIGIQHKISIRIMFVWWHFIIRIFHLNN